MARTRRWHAAHGGLVRGLLSASGLDLAAFGLAVTGDKHAVS